MTTLQQLIAERQALDDKIRELQVSEKSDAIAKVRALMEQSNLTIGDIFDKKEKTPKAGRGSVNKVAAKYRDQDGNAWSGRGLQPKWLNAAIAGGAKKEDFAV